MNPGLSNQDRPHPDAHDVLSVPGLAKRNRRAKVPVLLGTQSSAALTRYVYDLWKFPILFV